MKVYKDFLPQEQFNNLKNIVESNDFPWFYSNGATDNHNEDIPYDHQFVHFFYQRNSVCSKYYEYLVPILNKLKIFSLIKIKANLSTRVPKIQTNQYHIDLPDRPKDLKMKTAIYYLNNSNGPTKFKNGTEIKCEENKFIEFNSKLEHTSVFGTNSNKRIVINFNYLSF